MVSYVTHHTGELFLYKLPKTVGKYPYFVQNKQIKKFFCKLLTKCKRFGIIFKAQKRAPDM